VPPPQKIDWAARQRQLFVREILDGMTRQNRAGSTRKGVRPIMTKTQLDASAPKYTEEQLMAGFAALEALLPGFSPTLEGMSAAQWAEVAMDTKGTAAKIVTLKVVWPGVDLAQVLTRFPRPLLQTTAEITDDAAKVRDLLKRAKNPDAIIQAEPPLMVPKSLASVLVTINKWFHLAKDPVQVLENDPEIVRRAQEMDQPLEPVYQDEKGNWIVPELHYRERRADWQRYIDQQRYKQP